MEGNRGEKRSSSEDLGLTPPKVQAIGVGRGQNEPKQREANSPGDEFELTADMMVHDFDDERTLDEEESLEETDDQQNELSNLEKEATLPMEVLLALYGGKSGALYEEEEDGNESSNSGCSEEIVNSKVSQDTKSDLDNTETKIHLLDTADEFKCESNGEEKTNLLNNRPIITVEKEPSLLQELYKDEAIVVAASRHLRSGSRQHSEDEEEEEEEDCEYSPEEDEWKKVTTSTQLARTIMVGSDYQAVIPEGLSKYDDAMPYENEDKLLWDPASVDEAVVNYLNAVQDIQSSQSNGINSIPCGIHIRDDEQALYLLHQCGNNVEEALRRQKINALSLSSRSLWSEEECRNFETGLRQYGKDFYMIHQNRVRTRSAGELVQFYYLWKKTERHDVFANKARLEKKKYTLHPGTTDFMERYLDEQDAPTSTPNCHSLLAGDPKRYSRTPPPLQFINNESEPINVLEARIITTHFEDIAKHLDKESMESLTRLADSSAAKSSNGIAVSSDPSGSSSSGGSPFQPSEGRSNHAGFQQ